MAERSRPVRSQGVAGTWPVGRVAPAGGFAPADLGLPKYILGKIFGFLIEPHSLHYGFGYLNLFSRNSTIRFCYFRRTGKKVSKIKNTRLLFVLGSWIIIVIKVTKSGTRQSSDGPPDHANSGSDYLTPPVHGVIFTFVWFTELTWQASVT